MIDLVDVSKSYGPGLPAVNHVNLHIDKGEFVFIVGNSGSGKTTLVKLLMKEQDSTTGQNGLSQAKIFQEVTDVTGIILTKMDGTAKGGIAVAIQSELKVPVKYIGVGESIEDLQKFNSDEFVNALFDVNMDDIGELHLPEEEAGETDAEE